MENNGEIVTGIKKKKRYTHRKRTKTFQNYCKQVQSRAFNWRRDLTLMNQYEVAITKLLLYNGTVIKIKVNEWINNLKKISYVSPLSFGDTYDLYKL